MICFHCNRYGHLVEKCSERSESTLPTVVENNAREENQKSIISTAKSYYIYGNWMLVQKNRKQKKQTGKDKGNENVLASKKGETNNGSRFEVLNELFEGNILGDKGENNGDDMELTMEDQIGRDKENIRLGLKEQNKIKKT